MLSLDGDALPPAPLVKKLTDRHRGGGGGHIYCKDDKSRAVMKDRNKDRSPGEASRRRATDFLRVSSSSNSSIGDLCASFFQTFPLPVQVCTRRNGLTEV